MILNLSHITLGCNGVRESADILRRAGFQPKFIQEGLPNAEGKRPFLKGDAATHALSFCNGNGSTALELVDYSQPLSMARSPYRVLFGRRLPRSIPMPGQMKRESAFFSSLCEEAFGVPVEGALWEPFGTPYWHGTDPSAGMSVRAALVDVQEVRASAAFWVEGVGCRLLREGTAQGGPWVHLKFSTPVSPEGLDLILVQALGFGGVPHMDDPGFACVAFLALDLEGVSRRLKANGASAVGERFSIQVGGRPLSGRVFRGPNQELVEIIEVSREGQGAHATGH